MRLGDILDGDTITLSTGETVRLLGVDTPESMSRRARRRLRGRSVPRVRGRCCYGPQASTFSTGRSPAAAVCSGSSTIMSVRMSTGGARYAYLLPEEAEDSGEEVDEDEIFLNEELLKGDTRVYTADPSIRRYDDFLTLESQARDAGLGPGVPATDLREVLMSPEAVNPDPRLSPARSLTRGALRATSSAAAGLDPASSGCDPAQEIWTPSSPSPSS